MRVLAFDPSIALTGVGCVSNRGDQLVSRALIRTGDGDHQARAEELWADVGVELAELNPDIVVVETPSITGRGRRHWGYEGRSVLSAPVYGLAVGIVLGQAFLYRKANPNREIKVITRPADAWTKGLPGTADDEHKQGRVRLVEELFRLEAGALGAKTAAGNVADAILLARHVAAGMFVERSIKELQPCPKPASPPPPTPTPAPARRSRRGAKGADAPSPSGDE